MKIEEGAKVTPNVRLKRLLGEGGMGAVWIADHLSLGTEVAVKFLSGEYAQDATARARFSREAAAASRVKSSHVVKIYDHGITDTQVPFIVMELLEGTDLGHRMQRESKLNPTFVGTVVSQLCKALASAHDAGIVHRDIKPENVFLATEGDDVFVKLLDFGVAKTEQVLLQKTTGGRHSTMANESLGTPFYMSPEQFRSAKDIDFKSDLWSVGIVVYEALTGHLPFMGDTVSAVAIAVNEGKYTPPSALEPLLPKAIDAWFATACARDPKERFASARELALSLQDALAMPVELRVSMPSLPRLPALSASGKVIIRSATSDTEAAWKEDTEQADQPAALRDTSFATSGGLKTQPKRRVGLYAGIVAVASAIGIVGFWLSRPPAAIQGSTTASSSSSALTSSSLEKASPSPSVSTPASSATASSSAAPSAPASSGSAAALVSASVVVRPRASATSTTSHPSAKPSGERDIW